MTFPKKFVSQDEYGLSYVSHTFFSMEELKDEIRALEELHDESPVIRAVYIQSVIWQLRQLVHEEELEDETLPE